MIVQALFEHYVGMPDRLPPEWRTRAEGVRTQRTARLVADYIAGMTDRFAFQEYERHFESGELRR